MRAEETRIGGRYAMYERLEAETPAEALAAPTSSELWRDYVAHIPRAPLLEIAGYWHPQSTAAFLNSCAGVK